MFDTVNYSSWEQPLRELLAGCVIEFPSKMIGRGLVRFTPDKAALIERLQSVPGVFFTEREPEKLLQSDIYIPYNLFRMGERESLLLELEPDPIETTPSGLALKDYQRRAVSFLRRVDPLDGGAILAADPGLGKTITTLQALWLDGYLHRSGLIVGPLGASAVWSGDAADSYKHYGLQVTTITGTEPHTPILEAMATGGWWFIHYDILPSWQSFIFQHLKPASMIIDECHYAMNTSGKRHKATILVTGWKGTERRYGLTGTPVPKSRLDLCGQLMVVQPGQWGHNMYPYGIHYCGGHKMSHHEGQGHWVFDGQTNSDELRARLAGVYLRFTKGSVAQELPNLVRHRIDVKLPPDSAAEYKRARNTILKWLEDKGKIAAPQQVTLGNTTVTVEPEKPQALQLVTVSALKTILDGGKLPQALDVIRQLMHQHQRLVVYTWKRDSAKKLHKMLVDLNEDKPEIFGPLDGSSKCPWPKRRAVAKEFATADWSILVATRGSVGIAINDLSAADACLQVTPDWNPDGNLQAESRLHREGATAREIHSYYMLAKGTLDDRVLQLIDNKGREASALADKDRAGMHLAADLDPTLGDSSWSIEEICDLLDQIEEF